MNKNKYLSQAKYISEKIERKNIINSIFQLSGYTLEPDTNSNIYLELSFLSIVRNVCRTNRVFSSNHNHFTYRAH